MAQNMESRLALQAARGIAALQAVAKIRDLSNDAQTDRDEARITYGRRLEEINERFTKLVIDAVNEHERQMRSLAYDEDDYGEELDD